MKSMSIRINDPKWFLDSPTYVFSGENSISENGIGLDLSSIWLYWIKEKRRQMYCGRMYAICSLRAHQVWVHILLYRPDNTVKFSQKQSASTYYIQSNIPLESAFRFHVSIIQMKRPPFDLKLHFWFSSLWPTKNGIIPVKIPGRKSQRDRNHYENRYIQCIPVPNTRFGHNTHLHHMHSSSHCISLFWNKTKILAAEGKEVPSTSQGRCGYNEYALSPLVSVATGRFPISEWSWPPLTHSSNIKRFSEY